MRMDTVIETSRRLISTSTIAAAVAAVLVVSSSQFSFAQQAQAKSFPSAAQAAQALYDAVRNNDEQAVRAILGAGPELTSSGDQAVDKLERERFAEKYKQMHRLVRELDGRCVLYIGAENWPFPIPLSEKGGKWQFDATSGSREVAVRRIGENESVIIQVCKDFAGAAQPGAEKGATGDDASQFARLLASNDPKALQPFHGYQFRIPSGSAAGVVVAYPVEYGASGVMTFVALAGGSVYEKDLGPNTTKLALQINGKPAGDWVLVR